MASDDLMILVLIGAPVGAYFLIPDFKKMVNDALGIGNGNGGGTTDQLRSAAAIIAIYIYCSQTGKSGTRAQVLALTNKIYNCCKADLKKLPSIQTTAALVTLVKQIGTKVGMPCPKCTTTSIQGCVTQTGTSVREMAHSIID